MERKYFRHQIVEGFAMTLDCSIPATVNTRAEVEDHIATLKQRQNLLLKKLEDLRTQLTARGH